MLLYKGQEQYIVRNLLFLLYTSIPYQTAAAFRLINNLDTIYRIKYPSHTCLGLGNDIEMSTVVDHRYRHKISHRMQI